MISKFNEMKNLIFILIVVFPFLGFGQKDTVYYYGINGKIDKPVKKDIMKSVDYRGNNKIKVKTYKNSDADWQLIYTEKIKVINDSIFEIRMKGDEFSGRVTRIFEPFDKGYKFTDWMDKTVKRTGITKRKVPLIFEGTVTEHYNSGKMKSISEYRNNELISNKNWQPDGTELVENIFYSADNEPLFEPGMGFIHQQISQAIKDAKFDLLTVEGKMVVGLIITKDGNIGGVQIVKGISQTLNGILVDAFSKIEGAWVPAKLNGQDVNFFQTVPLNFIYNKYNFDYLEMDRGMMYWVIN
jgi:hypothetical protein